jgi:WD40 repeat protein
VVAPRSKNLKLEAVSSRLKSELIHPNKTASLLGLKFSPDGKRILAGDSPSGVVAVWDIVNGKRLTTIETSSRTFAVSPDWRTLFAPREKNKYERVEQDGKRMTRWTFEGEVRAWSLDDGKLLRTYKHQPPRGIRGIQLSPDGKKFITSEFLSGTYERSYKNSTSLWDVKSGKYRTRDRRQPFGKFSPDGRSFASILLDDEENYAQARKLIDVTNGQEKWSVPIADKNASVNVEAFSRDGRVLFGTVRVFDRPKKRDNWRSWMKWWDAATGREIASFEGDKNDRFLYFCSSPDGQTLGVLNWLGEKRKLFFYSIAEKRLLRTVLLGEKTEGQQLIASGLTFHPDGKWLAVITRSYPEQADSENISPRDLPQPRILLIEAATGAIRETLIAPQSFAIAACFSPDSRTLATGGYGRVLLWDTTKMPQ